MIGSFAAFDHESEVGIESKYVTLSAYAMIIFAVAALILEELGISVPYGRYSESLGKGWGYKVPARLAWVLMEAPNTIIFIAMLYMAHSKCIHSTPNLVLASLFLIHYIHRGFIFPLRMAPTGAPMPIAVMMIALLYCSWNATMQSFYLFRTHIYKDDWIYDTRFVIGCCLFFLGLACNIHADSTLLRLKAQKEKESNQGCAGGYKIPYGGLFEYVSCANYSGEIIEWVGFAIATWSLPGLAFAIMTFCNLAPRGHQHHKWYLKKFENYPKDRKAIIPFIW